MNYKNILFVLLPFVNYVNGLINFEYVFNNHCNKFDCFFNNKNTTEYNMRLEIFKNNLNFINEHNSKESKFKLGLNQFSVLTHEEYKNKLNLKQIKLVNNDLCENMPMVDDSNIESFDWVKEGKITSVKNQLDCGSCWAFSTIGAYENWYAKNNKLTDFSEQELVDCDTVDQGCNGGLMADGLSYIIKNGICLLNDYPYMAKDEKCKSSQCSKYPKLNGCYNVPANNNKLLKNAVDQNAVTIAIEADTVYFQHYSSGILDNSAKCGTNLDHRVLLVGYGIDNDTKYWLVKNSWSNSWGENGYIKILRSDSENDTGVCGIAMSAVYPY